MKTLVKFLMGTIILIMASAGHASDFPNRPITIVVPWGAGNGTDIVTRRLAQLLEEKLKVSVVVQNMPGAGGTIGSSHVYRAAPDGYTLLMASNADHGSAPSIYNEISYSP